MPVRGDVGNPMLDRPNILHSDLHALSRTTPGGVFQKGTAMARATGQARVDNVVQPAGIKYALRI